MKRALSLSQGEHIPRPLSHWLLTSLPSKGLYLMPIQEHLLQTWDFCDVSTFILKSCQAEKHTNFQLVIL